jgi:hypothetical protein
MHILGHFLSPISLKSTAFRKQALLPSSGEITQRNQLGPLEKAPGIKIAFPNGPN